MLWLARLIASEGLAVLTYDKRGVGKSGGQFQGGPSAASASNLDLLAQDATAAARVLVQHPRTGRTPIGYIGLSQGGWIIPIAASRPPAVSFMLFFSGPVATVSEERHFSDLAESDPAFWQTHSRADVAEYMKSVRYSDDDVDPRNNLATLPVPGFWAFGGQDNIMPVDLSVTRLRELIARGQSQFQYREYPGYGHDLVVFDFSTIALSPPFKDSVEWIRSSVGRASRPSTPFPVSSQSR
jgi:pimeloyl-ACP methyl ester carboxylesterase